MTERIVIPLWFAVLLLVLSFGMGMRGCQKEPTPSRPPKKAEIQYILDTAGLGAYKEQVAAAVGDSLARMVASRAASIRSRSRSNPSSPVLDTMILRDTVCLAGEDVRTIIFHDSSVIVSRDSARNFLAECSFDRDQLADSLARVEEPSRFWKWGFALSSVAVLTLGAVVWGTNP